MGSAAELRVDVHCHVGLRALPCQPNDRFSFEPAGQYAPYDAYFSDRLNGTIGMHLGKWLFGIGKGGDAELEKALLTQLLGATQIDRAVVLAFDQYHANDGNTLGQRRSNRELGTDLYVSNTYVRRLAREHPERILFGASIHPYRPGALAMLDEVAAAGAVLIKWLPPTHNIDAQDPRTVDFLRHAGRIGMPLLIHYGGEMSLGNMHREFEDPAPLLRSLRKLRNEGTMPTTIVAHCATPATWPFGSGRFFRMMVNALLGEFADAPLYTDTSALALFSRARWLKRLARMPEIHSKLVYGSDFPVPPTLLAFRRQLGRQYKEVAASSFAIDRDVAIKRALGLGDAHLRRTGEVLGQRAAET